MNYAQIRVLDEAASIARAVQDQQPSFHEVLRRLADVALARHAAALKAQSFQSVCLYANAVEWCQIAERLVDRPDLRPQYLPVLAAALTGLEAGMVVGVRL